MPFREDANALIQQKKFDDLEALWMNQIESDPSDVDTLLHSRRRCAKPSSARSPTRSSASSPTRSRRRKLWPQRLQVLKEIGRLSKHPAHPPPADRRSAAQEPSAITRTSTRAFQFANFADPQSNPVERAEKIETWLTYDEGRVLLHGRPRRRPASPS